MFVQVRTPQEFWVPVVLENWAEKRSEQNDFMNQTSMNQMNVPLAKLDEVGDRLFD